MFVIKAAFQLTSQADGDSVGRPSNILPLQHFRQRCCQAVWCHSEPSKSQPKSWKSFGKCQNGTLSISVWGLSCDTAFWTSEIRPTHCSAQSRQHIPVSHHKPTCFYIALVLKVKLWLFFPRLDLSESFIDWIVWPFWIGTFSSLSM